MQCQPASHRDATPGECQVFKLCDVASEVPFKPQKNSISRVPQRRRLQQPTAQMVQEGKAKRFSAPSNKVAPGLTPHILPHTCAQNAAFS